MLYEVITIPDLPDDVLGFTAKGKVTANDYEAVIIPAVEALFSRQSKVRFLYHLGEDFTGFEAAAVWDDMKLGLKHLAGWERVALVSDRITSYNVCYTKLLRSNAERLSAKFPLTLVPVHHVREALGLVGKKTS